LIEIKRTWHANGQALDETDACFIVRDEVSSA
jgi:hypothetical protein